MMADEYLHLVPEAREVLEDMVTQFAYRTSVGNVRCFSTGGLSALERAFDVLGWKDPQPATETTHDCCCEVMFCEEWATCVGAYPRSMGRKPDDPQNGFGFLCGNHMFRWSRPHAETPTPTDLGRIE